MISFAQNAEDVVLDRALGSVQNGFYVDVGANHPTIDSVTQHFSNLGWSGINIDPLPTYAALLREARPRDITLNVGVGADSGALTFFYAPAAPGMSTFSAAHADMVRGMGYDTMEITVSVLTLNRIFDDYVGDRTVDFLKVDVENFEEEVLGSFDFVRWRPRVLVVETFEDVSPWERRMLATGYRRTLWDGINVFFVRDEDYEELGPKLHAPATMALDRYSLWSSLQQLDYAYNIIAGILFSSLQDSLTTALVQEQPHYAAMKALSQVLKDRPDVAEAFVVQPRVDLRGLLRWATDAPDRSSELAVDLLVPHRRTYSELVDLLERRAIA